MSRLDASEAIPGPLTPEAPVEAPQQRRRSARGAFLAVAGVALTVLTLAGCSAAPDPTVMTPHVEQVRWPINGGESVVTTFCDHGNRVYSGETLAVVPADPTCAGGPS